jgi:crossover junction endodeoxyribonuclease RuvC
LAALEADLEDLMAEVQPGAVAVERVLFQVNARTAISVGQASGLALAVAARAGVPVVQYSPNEVKLAVTGDGAADKLAVQTMVTRLLDLPSAPQPADAADALALALCHSWRARIDGGVPAVDASVPSRLQTAISAALASAPAQRNPR